MAILYTLDRLDVRKVAAVFVNTVDTMRTETHPFCGEIPTNWWHSHVPYKTPYSMALNDVITLIVHILAVAIDRRRICGSIINVSMLFEALQETSRHFVSLDALKMLRELVDHEEKFKSENDPKQKEEYGDKEIETEVGTARQHKWFLSDTLAGHILDKIGDISDKNESSDQLESRRVTRRSGRPQKQKQGDTLAVPHSNSQPNKRPPFSLLFHPVKRQRRYASEELDVMEVQWRRDEAKVSAELDVTISRLSVDMDLKDKLSKVEGYDLIQRLEAVIDVFGEVTQRHLDLKEEVQRRRDECSRSES
ncbi:hypothetical protein BKA56DRAFT_165802 [Ilyonectria sp. MPI-CAGE-AT-0026]|nr:hypothetical protein BKA56DRAFT_165802 [Ilyonectria sp. MPI-CAGE-AT-0026]